MEKDLSDLSLTLLKSSELSSPVCCLTHRQTYHFSHMKSREVAPGVFSMKPYDVLIYTNEFGVERRYTIGAVMVGTLKEEGYVEVTPSFDTSVTLHFPIALLNLALSTGECQIYEG